jgi:hypothetical protein
MKRFFDWLVSLGIWRPGAAIMRNMPVPAKMGLIAVTAVLPVMWLLANFVMSQRDALLFVAGERDGVHLAQAIYPALHASGNWRYHARSVAIGEPGASADESRRNFEAAYKKLDDAQGKVGHALDTGAAWGKVQQAFKVAQAGERGKPDEVLASMTELSRALTAMLNDVTDKSGLALDPDMASYYVMSATLMRGPQVMQGTGELRGLAGGALKAGKLTPAQFARINQQMAVVSHELALAAQDFEQGPRRRPRHGTPTQGVCR